MQVKFLAVAKNKKTYIKKSIWYAGQILASVFVLFISVFTLYHVFLADRIIPGVTVAGVELGGLRFDNALSKLETSSQSAKNEISFKYNDAVYSVSLGELGLSYNWSETVKSAFSYGRSGNILKDSKNKLLGLVIPLRIDPVFAYDESVLDVFLSEITGATDIKSQNAAFVISNNEIKIEPEKSGLKVNREDLYNSVISSIKSREFEPLTIPVEEDIPRLAVEDLEKVADDVKKILNTELTIINPEESAGDDNSFIVSRVQKLSLLDFEKKAFNRVEVVINEETLDQFTDSINKNVLSSPRGKVTEFTDNRVVKFELTEKGVELDQETFSKDLAAALLNDKTEVTLPLKTVEGPVDPEKYGIVALIGEGESRYVGSAASRANNLQLATTRAGGVLVPPNGIYSLNESVGEISSATGYDTAYIISNGRTILGEGGGVCQCSTTLFRAVLNAGLPVVERHAHAYRVTYYEQDEPVGLDAAIYQPTLDFKFKNDTPNWILLQTEYDASAQKLNYFIFGTPDGREVEITDPVVTNSTPPPEAKYQDDPTLLKGTVKQVDFAAWGANVSFNRTVTRNGEVLYEDVFKSNYRPWQAVYLVGTKED